MNTSSALPQLDRCHHCANPLPKSRLHEGTRGDVKSATAASRFCGQGCETVYGALHSMGLGDYYRIQRRGGWLREALPADAALAGETRFGYLDDPAFKKAYA